MKLFLLGAAALIAAPVMAQQQTTTGADTTATAPAPQAGSTGDMGTSSTTAAPADQSMQTPPPADGAMQAPGQPPMGQPGAPMNGQAVGTSPSGAPIVMGPMNTTPPPAATANPPVCKRGQTDDCIEPGARRKGRR